MNSHHNLLRAQGGYKPMAARGCSIHQSLRPWVTCCSCVKQNYGFYSCSGADMNWAHQPRAYHRLVINANYVNYIYLTDYFFFGGATRIATATLSKSPLAGWRPVAKRSCGNRPLLLLRTRCTFSILTERLSGNTKINHSIRIEKAASVYALVNGVVISAYSPPSNTRMGLFWQLPFLNVPSR